MDKVTERYVIQLCKNQPRETYIIRDAYNFRRGLST